MTNEFERVIEYVDERRGLKVKLWVREATVLDSMKRAVLSAAASTWLEAYKLASDGKARPIDVSALRYASEALYPDLLATTFKYEGLDPDISVERFIELPDRLVGVWSDAVYELNPHWLGIPEPEDEEEREELKKESRPDGSKSGDG